MTSERLKWITDWASGWRRSLDELEPGSEHYYQLLPLDVATSMILELAADMRAGDEGRTSP